MRLSRLIFVNVFDHLGAMSRVLSSTDSITLYSHETLVRVACEGAARIGYLLDPAVGFDVRLLRTGVLELADADAQVATVRSVAAARPELAHAVDRAIKRREGLLGQLERSGMTVRMKGQKPTHLELGDPACIVPCKLNLTGLVEQHFPGRPGSYRSASGIVHSNPWTLGDTVSSSPLTAELVLEPDIMGIGAATIIAIDASIVITASYAQYYGHDPESAARASRLRAHALDVLMQEYFAERVMR
jgi:hypothetical protein